VAARRDGFYLSDGGLIVPPTKTVRYGPYAALLSLGRQREMHYLHHYATTDSLSCHFVAS